MDSDFCRGCERLERRLVENTCRGSKHMLPFRCVFVQMACNGRILSMEPVGQPEFVDEEYAILCQPNSTCSNVIDSKFLSEQMLRDYDDACQRAFGRIDGYSTNELPEQCIYRMEQELSSLNEEM